MTKRYTVELAFGDGPGDLDAYATTYSVYTRDASSAVKEAMRVGALHERQAANGRIRNPRAIIGALLVSGDDFRYYRRDTVRVGETVGGRIERAGRAIAAFKASGLRSYGAHASEDVIDDTVDLLADLLHFAQARGLDSEAILRSAWHHYTAERDRSDGFGDSEEVSE